MTGTALAEAQPRSVLLDMAHRYGMEPVAFERVVRATCIKPDKQGREASREEFAAFLLVAKEYGLNPLTKEIFAFRDQRGGIMPLVSVDGWSNLINSHPMYDGMDFEDEINSSGKIVAISCRMHRKDRSHPIVVTEYLSECARDTEPWKKWPARMLRHKAMIQAARYAFGFAGIYDPDEAERIASTRDVTPRSSTIQNRLSGPVGQGFSRQHVEDEMGDDTRSGVADDADTSTDETGRGETETGRSAGPQDDTTSDREDHNPQGEEDAGQQSSASTDEPDPDAPAEEVSEAYEAGRQARREGVGTSAMSKKYSAQEQADWKAGWKEEDAAQKGGVR